MPTLAENKKAKMKLGTNLAVAACCLGLSGVLALPGEALSQEVKYEDATPSHVYQVTSDLISEIEILREEMGIAVYPVEAELQEDRALVHVYAKSLEVLEKISAAQRRLGIDPARIGQIPVKEIKPGDVYRSVQTSLAEVRKIKEQLVIEQEIRPAPFEGGKTPTYVYQHLGVRLPGEGPHDARDKTTADVFARVLLDVRNLDIMRKAAEDAG